MRSEHTEIKTGIGNGRLSSGGGAGGEAEGAGVVSGAAAGSASHQAGLESTELFARAIARVEARYGDEDEKNVCGHALV